MSANWIPRPDEEFGPAGRKIIAGATGREATVGLTPAQLLVFTDLMDDWDNLYAAHQTAQGAASTAKVLKDNARAAAETAMRAINTTVQAKTDASVETKNNMGLPTHDTTRTPAAVPTTRPLLVVDTSERLQHTLTYRDEATPNRKAKPAGVREIEVWAKIGAPAPIGPSECSLIGTSPSSSLVITHKDTDAGKPVHYIGRWKSTRGDTGPWSETVIATIGA